MQLCKALSTAISDHPVQKVESVLFVIGVSGHPKPVHRDGQCRHDYSRGHREPEVGGEAEEGSTDGETCEGDVERGVEGAIEVGGDAGVDVFVEVNFVLVDFSEFLLALEQIEGE